MREATILVTLTSLVLAGCLGPISGGEVAAPLEFSSDWSGAALASGHDHADPALHAGLSTPNFEIVGWTPLISEEYGTTVQGALCGDAASVADGRRLAAVQGRGDVVFTLADVTDPANPVWLGELVMRTSYVYDLAVVPDGKHVVLVTSDARTPERPPTGTGLEWRSPCAEGGLARWHDVPVAFPGEDLVPRPNSLVLVSIEDPSSPVIVDQRPLGGYGHGVSSAELDGRTLVAGASLGCLPGVPGSPVRCPSWRATWHFYEVVDGRLSLLSLYHVPVTSEALSRENYHNDVWMSVHPATGKATAWVAAWDDGLHVLDVSDPREPTLLGTWTDYDPERHADFGKMHSAYPFPGLVDGRHFTLVGPEHAGKPESHPGGVVYVLDTTDPSSPKAVAGWALPHDVVWEGRLMWSTHYLSAYGSTAFVSNYHGGVWALDLSVVGGDEFVLLPSVGVFLPTNVSPSPPERPIRWAPTLEEVLVLEDGTLVTFDSNTGLYAFRFDASHPAPAPAPWPVETP